MEKEEFLKKYRYTEKQNVPAGNNTHKRGQARSKSGQGVKKYYTKRGTLYKIKGSMKIIGDELKEKWKKVTIIGVAGLMTLNIINGVNKSIQYRRQHDTIGISDALKSGDTIESLGVANKDYDEFILLSNLQGNTNQFIDMNNTELINLSHRIVTLQYNILDEKLAKLFDTKVYNIRLREGHMFGGDYIDTSIIVDDNLNSKFYYRESTNFLNKNVISDNIADYIEQISDMKRINAQVNKESFNREKVINSYIHALDEIDKMSATKLYLDDKRKY